MKRKLLSLALAVALCLGLMTVPASAAASAVVKPLEGYGTAFHYRFYSDGMLAVEKTGGYTYLDKDGNEIPGALFDNAMNFSEGLAAVEPDIANQSEYKGFGYIDKTGKMVIQPQFSTAGYFHNGLARVQDYETKKWGIIDKSGSVVIPLTYGEKALREPSDGLIAAYDAPSGFWGYFDTTGKVAIPFQYASAEDFENGYAKVLLGNRYTYIDKSGRDIIPQQYENIERFTVDGEPAALFKGEDTTVTGSRYYLLNGSGQVLAGPYAYMYGYYEFSCGLVRVVRDNSGNSLTGYINTAGQEVIPCQFKEAGAFVDGYALVTTQDGNNAIINTAGQVTATLSKDIKYNTSTKTPSGFRGWAEGMLAVYNDASGRDRKGFINASGTLVADYKYQSVEAFSGGVAVVRDFANKYGVINTAGVEILPCKYNSIGEFINGVAVVRDSNGKYGLINTAGQEIVPCEYYEGISNDSGSMNALKDSLEKGGQEVCAILQNADTNDLYFIRITLDAAAPAQPETPVTPVQPVTPTVGNFTDVAATSPFKDAILWAVDQGITNGTSGTTFSPSATCTVRQILTFLYRAAGKPGAAEGQSDLDAAVAWAVREGLLAEGADSAAACTRSMAVEFMWKAAGSPAPTQSASFSDVSADAGYAAAVAWAVEKGITNGTGGDTFSPDNTCTRGQIVTFLYRNK